MLKPGSKKSQTVAFDEDQPAPVTALAVSGRIGPPKSKRRAGRCDMAEKPPAAVSDSAPDREANLPSVGLTRDAPACSETQKMGAQGRLAMRSIGLDLGSKKIHFCEVFNEKVVRRGTAPNIEAMDDLLGPNKPAARVAIEACREAWHVHDFLTGRGHEVLLVDTTRVKKLGIGQHGRKNDKIDAEVLARGVEENRIPKAHVLSPARRDMRAQLFVRKALVETRSQYIITVRGILRSRGIRLRSCAGEDFISNYQKAKIPADVSALCSSLIALLINLGTEIVKVDHTIYGLAERDPVHTPLMTIPGVGLIVAVAFVGVVDDAHRFKNAHKLASYLGLVAREDTTGGNRKLGAISKCGNSYLRTLLVQAAWSIFKLKEDDPVKQWGEAVAARRCRRIATVAIARRMSGIMWAVWRDGTVYDPAVVGKASVAGTVKEAQSTLLRADAILNATKKAKRYTRVKNQGKVATMNATP